MSASMQDAFRGAVERILNSWTALQLAVEHGFGGIESREKAVWMVEAVDQWFSENNDIDPWELEDFLAEIMNNEFDTVADDESLPQVSQMICGCYKMLKSGDSAGVKEKLDKLPQPKLNKCVANQSNHDAIPTSEDDIVEEYQPTRVLVNGMRQLDTQDSGGQDGPSTSHTSTQDTSGGTEGSEDADGWVTVSKKGKRR